MALSEKVVILSGAISGDGNSAQVSLPNAGAGESYYLSAVASAVGAGTSLVVKLQHSPDGGTTWFDVASGALTAVTPGSPAQGLAIQSGLLPVVRVNYDFTGGTTTATLDVAINCGVSK